MVRECVCACVCMCVPVVKPQLAYDFVFLFLETAFVEAGFAAAFRPFGRIACIPWT